MCSQAKKSTPSSETSKMLPDFKEACRKAGLKATQQRIEIFYQLAASHDHPSAETIYNSLQKKLPTISLDTVYRTLATFEKHGLITRIQTPESLARFEVETDTHHHIVCTKCGRITDFKWSLFDDSQIPQDISNWGSINKKNVLLQGICNKCSD